MVPMAAILRELNVIPVANNHAKYVFSCGVRIHIIFTISMMQCRLIN